MVFNEEKKLTNTLPLVTSGFYFGILQTAIYFSIEVFVTATFAGYFLLILAWMGGVIFSIKTDIVEDFFSSLTLSIIVFYIFLLFVALTPPQPVVYPLLFLLIFISSIPAGKFFRLYGKSVSSDVLFFHENNGFVFGLVVSLLLFVKFGILFVYFAPLFSFCLVLLSIKERNNEGLGIILLVILFFIWQHYWLGVITFISLYIFLLISKTIFPKPVELPSLLDENVDAELSNNKLKAIIMIAGFNLILLQYFIVREFSTIISANELSILLVSVAYMIGFSVGYSISSHLTFSFLKIISVATFVLHLVIFIGIKFFASYLLSEGFSFEMLLLLLFVSSLLTSSFYSIFLPKFIQFKGNHTLPFFYNIELIGAASGIIFFFFIVSSAQYFLFPVYFLMLLLLVLILLNKNKWAFPFLFLGLYLIGIFTSNQKEITTAGTIDYYQSLGYSNPKILFSDNSFYHSVDVIQTYYDRFQKIKQSKISFLNGQKYFVYDYPFPGITTEETSLSEFTYFLANLPAHYKFKRDGKKQRVLILGGGSLYSINRVAPYSAKTTVVEIDPKVIESSKKCWSEINQHNRLQNYEIIIDDAKRYLKTTNEHFDLIIMDISAPYYLGSALLHNKEFFELVKSKLKPGGIFSESTQGRPDPHFPSSTAMRILKAVHEVFPNYFVIDCKMAPRGKRGFIMASDHNAPILFNDIVELLKQDRKLAGTSFYGKNDADMNLSHVKPLSLYSMENLWNGNLKRIKTRLFAAKSRTNHIEFCFPAYLKREYLNPYFLGLTLIIISLAITIRYLPQKRISKKKET